MCSKIDIEIDHTAAGHPLPHFANGHNRATYSTTATAAPHHHPTTPYKWMYLSYVVHGVYDLVPYVSIYCGVSVYVRPIYWGVVAFMSFHTYSYIHKYRYSVETKRNFTINSHVLYKCILLAENLPRIWNERANACFVEFIYSKTAV